MAAARTGEADLDQGLTDLYHRSLLIVRTQIDNGGAIIAANDTDNMQFNRDVYSYMWPRDGALVADAMGQADFGTLTQQFYSFCADILRPDGFMAHKYGPDGSEGSSWHPWSTASGDLQLPIQEDETALVIWALGRQFERDSHVEIIKPLYAGLIKKSAEFLCEFRDPDSGLPAASYDLWEERHGVHAWTVATVWAGLQAAAMFARGFGEDDFADRYRKAAASIREATERLFFDETEGRFVRRLIPDGSGGYSKDMVVDSSLYGLFYFGMFPADDPRIVATMQRVKERLWVQTQVGGLARYENDYYHQVSSDIEKVPGNPMVYLHDVACPVVCGRRIGCGRSGSRKGADAMGAGPGSSLGNSCRAGGSIFKRSHERFAADVEPCHIRRALSGVRGQAQGPDGKSAAFPNPKVRATEGGLRRPLACGSSPRPRPNSASLS